MNDIRPRVWWALAGPAAIVVALIGWLIAGILPKPPAADLSAEATVAFHANNPNAIGYWFMDLRSSTRGFVPSSLVGSFF